MNRRERLALTLERMRAMDACGCDKEEGTVLGRCAFCVLTENLQSEVARP